MANVQYYDVILKPVVTEKSMNAPHKPDALFFHRNFLYYLSSILVLSYHCFLCYTFYRVLIFF